MKTGLLLGAALIVAQLATVPSYGKAKSVRAPFTQISFTPTDGRVGYRFGSGPLFLNDDVPAGNTGGAFSGSCQGHYNYISHTGDLPPGIEEHNAGGTVDVLAGTPRQPGRWTIIVNLSVSCSAGPDVTLYQRQVPVTFNIEP